MSKDLTFTIIAQAVCGRSLFVTREGRQVPFDMRLEPNSRMTLMANDVMPNAEFEVAVRPISCTVVVLMPAPITRWPDFNVNPPLVG